MTIEPPKLENPQHKKRKQWALFYWIIVLILFLSLLLYWFFVWQYYEYTNDAYVEGNQVFITPLRPGFITAIHTDDTFLVKKGQLLIELDRTDSLIALQQSEKELATIVREVSQMFHQVFSYKAEMEVKKAELIKAAQDFKHRYDVLASEAVSLEDYQHAVAALRAGYFALKMTESLYNKSLAIVQGTTIKNHPLVLSAAEKMRTAWVQLYRCRIYSPVEGLAAQRKIQVGMWVSSGQSLMSVIPLDQIWINANFKETQMKYMRIGQCANITSDLYGDEIVYHGYIVGLPGGAGNVFSLLPPQNLSGNWIKIVQRLPVRICLDTCELEKYPLRMGLSMEVTVDLHDQNGMRVPTSNADAPIYATAIYEEEESGDKAAIAQIIDNNLDPTLHVYAHTPLAEKQFSIDSEIEQYLSTAALLEKNAPLAPSDSLLKSPSP